VLAFLLLAMAGCSQQLYEDLSEQEANDVTATLRMEDIDATKFSMKDKRWGVSVPPGDFAQSVRILRERNMPMLGFEGLGKMFKKDSLLITPTEERARLMHALSEELTMTFRQMDGVLDARVHVVIPPRDLLPDAVKPSSAAVLIKTRPGVDMSEQLSSIKQMVVNSVEGVSPETVTVLAMPASLPAAPKEHGVAATIRTASIVIFALGVLAVLVWAAIRSRFGGDIKGKIGAYSLKSAKADAGEAS
jgi:type III secretion protein J